MILVSHVSCLDAKFYFRSLTAPNPVNLLLLDFFQIVNRFQIVDKPVRVLCNANHPLFLVALFHLTATAFARTTNNLLVGQTYFTRHAPVNRHSFFVRQSRFEKLQKHPLRPLVIGWIRGVDFTLPVKRQADGLHLLFENGDVFRRHICRFSPRFYGVIFRWKTECVPAYWIEHVVAIHASLARNDVHSRITANVSHMQARAGWVRELHECIELGLLGFFVSLKHTSTLKALLPLFFYKCVIVRVHAL